jgi:hypothetical protein
MALQPSWALAFSLPGFHYHTQIHHSLGLLSTSDRPVVETST